MNQSGGSAAALLLIVLWTVLSAPVLAESIVAVAAVSRLVAHRTSIVAEHVRARNRSGPFDVTAPGSSR